MATLLMRGAMENQQPQQPDKDELKQRKKAFRCVVDIGIRVYSDGNMEIKGPPNLELFKETVKQAVTIVEANAKGKKGRDGSLTLLQ